ncbi:DUF5994 family protein [Mycolicibacterium agri]|nr:DUF5994 family protein [Mycolicibacterium agri]
MGNLRLRLKPPHRSCGIVQGAWWPRTDQLRVELPPLLTAVSRRVGPIARVVYDETSWTSTPSAAELDGRSILLEASSVAPTDTLSVFGEWINRLVLLVVPPYTNPTRAYMAVVAASNPHDDSTPDELLGITPREAHDRRLAVSARQRWESGGGAAIDVEAVRRAQ